MATERGKKRESRKKRVPRVWVDMLVRRDAIGLCRWWNSTLLHPRATYQEHEIRRSSSNPKFWAVYRV